MNDFYVVSLGYAKANSEIRGKFTFFPEQTESFAKKIEILKDTRIFILSTCNRTELYVCTDDIDRILKIFCEQIEVSVQEFKEYVNIYKSEKAIIHFLRVSAGLESQIIGDFEIISQIKTWFKRFKSYNLTNAFLERLVNTGIQTSKKVKTRTSLSSGVTSMSYAAAHYVLTNNFANKKVTILGAGEIGRNVCDNLVKHLDFPDITLINRTESRAREIAKLLPSIKVKPYSELISQVNSSDVVIVATGASQPILKKEDININNRDITFIDLSIPNNVSLSVRDLDSITLIGIDDLSQTIKATFEQRKKEIPKAEKIVDKMLDEFMVWIENRRYVSVIHAFKSDLERIKEYQIKTLKKDQFEISLEEAELSDRLVQKITNRFADYLIKNPEKAQTTITVFKEIFQLQDIKY